MGGGGQYYVRRHYMTEYGNVDMILLTLFNAWKAVGMLTSLI